MSRNYSLPIIAWTVLSIGAVACGSAAAQSPATQGQAQPSGRWSHQDWPSGHYKVVEGWPKPLPDTRHSHDGWTWGSFGGVYAESPDRIWVAMRGELPLPKGAAPWTPYAALNPSRGNSTGNSDGLSATCQPEQKRGWERRFEHSIIVFDRQGNLVDEWPHLDKLFSQLPCGRGPHQIKISPYDKDKHVWIIDDQLHMIYRFTYDGKLVHSKGQLGVRGRGPNTFDRPTDIAWLPDGTYFITDGYGGKRVVKFDLKGNFLYSWGAPGNQAGRLNCSHGITTDQLGNLYLADCFAGRLQKFEPIAGADPDKIAGQILRTWDTWKRP